MRKLLIGFLFLFSVAANAQIQYGGQIRTALPSPVTILQNAVAVTGNGANFISTGYGTTVITISGTFVATVNFEFSADAGTTWMPISATQIGAGDIFTQVTSPGSFRLTCTGLDLIRARVTWTSGTSITINAKGTNAVNASKIVKLASGTNIFGKGYITDGTNTVGITSANIGGNETTLDRLKVNASLRMIDVGQAVGSQLVGVTGTQAAGMNVNIKNASLAVTGPFFQTTQPVSLATNTPTLQAGSTTAVTQATAANLNATVVGTVTANAGTGTMAVSLATNTPILAAGTNKIGSVDISASVPLITTAAAALNADLVAATDVSAYKSVSIQLSGTWSGTISFQGCNDNVTFLPVVAENINVTGVSMTTNTTLSNLLWHIPIKFKFLRIRMTTFTSGSATSTAVAYTDDRGVNTTNVSIGSGSSIGLNVSTTNIGGVLPRGTNLNGNTMSSLNSAATTNATLVKATAATVYTITAMNTSAATKFIRIYNLTTAPTVGTSVPVIVVAIPATSSKELEFGMGMPFNVGLSYSITGGAAVTDATVVAAGDVQFTISWN